MIIHVTQTDIAQADAARLCLGFYPPSECHIAQAIQRCGYKVVVGPKSVWLNGKKRRTPKSARAFIYEWDHWHPVSPIQFHLRG